MIISALFVGAYLLGSIPSAVWIGKIFYGVDVRTQGSGNAGTTNVLRVLGAKAALPVFAIDILKGCNIRRCREMYVVISEEDTEEEQH